MIEVYKQSKNGQYILIEKVSEWKMINFADGKLVIIVEDGIKHYPARETFFKYAN